MTRVGVKGEAKHRPLLRLRVKEESQKRLHERIEPGCRVEGCGLGEQSSRLDLRVGRDEQLPLVLKVAICRGPRDSGMGRGVLDGGRYALGDELASRRDQRAASAVLLVRAPNAFIW